MMNIDYTLIGSIPSVEQCRNILPSMMEQILVMKAKPKRSDAFDEQFQGDRDTILRLEIVIEQCAAHFYGIEASDFDTIDELIEAINGVDQDLEI